MTGSLFTFITYKLVVNTSISISIKLVNRKLWSTFHDQVKYCRGILFAKLTKDVKHVLTTGNITPHIILPAAFDM